MDNIVNISDELDDKHLTAQSSCKFPFNLYLAKNNPQNPSKDSKFSLNIEYTSLVSKLEDFLPKIALANEELLSLPKDSVDIEQVECPDNFIEMNLQLYENSSTGSDSSDTEDELVDLKLQPAATLESFNNTLIIEEERSPNLKD